MTSLYDTFKTNKSLEKDGVFLEYGKTKGGKPVRIKIARAGGMNIEFGKALERATKPYKRQLQSGTMDNEVAERLFREVYADTVILGWENVHDENDKPLPFKRENVIKILTDLPDLFADLRQASAEVSTFRDEERKADLGN